MTLQDKTVFITGADSGIGQQIALACARAGADVAIGYHTDQQGAAHTKEGVEGEERRAIALQLDVGDPQSVDAFFAKATAELGTPDIFIANAGRGMGGMPVADMDDAKLEQILRIELMGPLFCARPFIKARKQASWRRRPAADHRFGGRAPADTRQRALWHGQGWREFFGAQPERRAGPRQDQRQCHRARSDRDPHDGETGRRPGQAPRKRTGDPLGAASVNRKRLPAWRFLVSDDADYMTGQTVVMDGGLNHELGRRLSA